tara:strand:+ start:127 stop:447 length:321 start_codon:yes stop_codon:yes gene_type:complete
MNGSVIFLLALSLSLNILLIWYARRLTGQFVFFTENIDEIKEYLKIFESHIKSIYELEVFYGDSTLEGLIQHSKELIQRISYFSDGFSLEDGEVDEEGIDILDGSA